MPPPDASEPSMLNGPGADMPRQPNGPRANVNIDFGAGQQAREVRELRDALKELREVLVGIAGLQGQVHSAFSGMGRDIQALGPNGGKPKFHRQTVFNGAGAAALLGGAQQLTGEQNPTLGTVWAAGKDWLSRQRQSLGPAHQGGVGGGGTPAPVLPPINLGGTSQPSAAPPGGPQYHGGAAGNYLGRTGGNVPQASQGLASTALSALSGSGISDLLSNMNSSTATGVGAIAEALTSLVMKPVQFAYNRVEENRGAALTMSKYLGPTANRMGIKSQDRIEELIGMLSESIPMRGGMEDILAATDVASGLGFTLNDRTGRSGGFFGAARQFQMMNPSKSAASIVSGLGEFMGNSQAVQRSVMLTGGVFNLQGAGGHTKTLQEWAEGLLKFFQNQRPGADRGKPFTKEQLEVQHFPGSNIDAWFRANDVPAYMQDAFWQYAITRAAYGSTDFNEMFGGIDGDNKSRGVNNLALERLNGLTYNARRDFTMASGESIAGGGSMYKHYGTRERTDAMFQNFLSQTIDSLIPQIAGPAGQVTDKIPTSIADMLMKAMTTTLPALVGAGGQFLAGLVPTMSLGDPGYAEGIGDTGYGPLGGGMSHLNPSMRDRLGAMMRDNPRLHIVSGHRDGGTQQRLRGRGVGNLAPVGQSTHSAGLAADLGPADQYDWIAKNAHRYGLQSAAHHGEKWHVGMPGTVGVFGSGGDRHGGIGDWTDWGPDIIDVITNPWESIGKEIGSRISGSGDGNSVVGGAIDVGTSVASGVIDAAGDISQYIGLANDIMDGDFGSLMDFIDPSSMIGSLGSGLLNLLIGKIPALGQIPGMPDVLAALTGMKTGKGFGTSTIRSAGGWRSAIGGAVGNAVNSAANTVIGAVGGPGGSGPSNLTGKAKGIELAMDAAYKAGFRGQALREIVAIAYAESGWDPKAHGVGPKDDSYGLWQINMLPAAGGPGRRKKYNLTSDSMLFDPYLNAKVAYDISGGTVAGMRNPWKAEYVTPSAIKRKASVQDQVNQLASRLGYEDGGLIMRPGFYGGEGNKPEVVVPLTNPQRVKQLTDAFIRPVYPKTSNDSMFDVSTTARPTTSGTQVHIPIEVKVTVNGRASDADLRVVGRAVATVVRDHLADVVENDS